MQTAFVQVSGSMLATWFGPLWADRQKLDSQGRIFVDCDPYCFEKILSFLRCKLVECPETPALQPIIQEESQAEFETLLHYLGLQDCIASPDQTAEDGFTAAARDFCFRSAPGMSLTNDGHVGMARAGSDIVCFAAPAMQDGTVNFIKCSITSLTERGYIFMGVTQLSDPTMSAETDLTSYGWSTRSEYCKGRWTPADPQPCWQEGDELVFKVDLTSYLLSVWCSRFPHLLHIQVDLDPFLLNPFSFFFSAIAGFKVQLSAATLQDRRKFK